VRASVRALLDGGATALVLHCDDAAHAAVLDEVTRRGLAVPHDVSVVSVGATFDTTAFHPPIDSVPLVPQASCDLAVDLAMRLVEGDDVAPRVHRIEPGYQDRGSTAPPP
jgi:DNA-binding LacI/PurR family transcriptional regulator